MTGGICNHWESHIKLIIHYIFLCCRTEKRKYSCSTSSEYFKVSHLNHTALFIIYHLWVTLEEKNKTFLIISYAVVHTRVCSLCTMSVEYR